MNGFEDHRRNALRALAESTATRLRERGYSASVVEDRDSARELILSLIPEDAHVGVPGSVTVRDIGLLGALERRGNRVIQHWGDMTPEERKQRLLEEIMADAFVTSANALSKDGHIVNIDGAGNRVAGISFGPGKLIFVVGVNKIVHDLDAALKRARQAASPNASRLNSPVPCGRTGFCVDCNVPERMCRVISILERCPMGRDAHVIIVLQNLGY
ncbi:lactate utilization protein [Thermanaerovibrio acidaminovorans]|jgi:hypothetical protein|uniref:LUD domain-containing protein n=1 Tax=Thermanaerovibrio acidaminovorans (strain ATCC 49978 / DSM 6589 / Su883) TaxID=525903 RepID=D1B981_THEAS|nr:lactate utilization protein [Thermanaerovibrio acidaminovorans]ACZ18834.1 protein of unknown function DUF1121 [Thermanaerovibrio acidaminovorans DSM 6589]